MGEPLSSNALKLARAIYNTYLTYDDLDMEIKFATFFKLLNLHPCKDSINDIQDLLEELNEPIAVRNFEFHGEVTQLKFVQLCTYSIKKETIEINLNEEYLHAHNTYMLDSFLGK
ncbi:MAG: hypothetical protein OQK48_00025 [Sulfurimonas sp.]|uniref:hypothetical protein n=1 Tax=Sulfurimonas sp. TaxID=2022749 RepID=UPI00261053F6|nr:hypothetical protein [Sulfurimonas sp.]MCW8895739.1 hypothetical protein [Sulfurimonas sp.]MCW8953308.1 hypothetical protein [Sulfurimonas sp.]